jgi:hypothetical protein
MRPLGEPVDCLSNRRRGGIPLQSSATDGVERVTGKAAVAQDQRFRPAHPHAGHLLLHPGEVGGEVCVSRIS